MTSKLIASGVVWLATIGSGIWLSKLGKPYSLFLFNIHKVIGLTFFVFISLISKKLFKTMEANPIIWIFIAAATLSSILILVTGGMLSHHEVVRTGLVSTHKISTMVLLLSLTGWFFMALG